MTAGEVHGRLALVLSDERVAVERDERGREHRPHELPDVCAQCAIASGQGVAELSCHPLCAERLCACDTVGVEREGGGEACGELRDPSQRVLVLERPLKLRGDDRVCVSGLVAAGFADGLLAFGVGPAGAIGDQLAVVADQQPANDVPDRA